MKTAFALGLVCLFVTTAGEAATRRPTIALDHLSPLLVVGTGFGPGTTVRVVVTAPPKRLVKTVRATATGRVTARWATSVRLDGCHAGLIRAVGSDGRTATWKPVPSKNCGTDRMPVDPVSK